MSGIQSPFYLPSSPSSPSLLTHTQRAPDLVSLALVRRSLIGLMLLTPVCIDLPFKAKSPAAAHENEKEAPCAQQSHPAKSVEVTSRIGAVSKPRSSCPCLRRGPVLSDSAEAGPRNSSAHAPEFPLHAKSSECPSPLCPGPEGNAGEVALTQPMLTRPAEPQDRGSAGRKGAEGKVTGQTPDTQENSCLNLFNPSLRQLMSEPPLTRDSIKHAILKREMGFTESLFRIPLSDLS